MIASTRGRSRHYDAWRWRNDDKWTSNPEGVEVQSQGWNPWTHGVGGDDEAKLSEALKLSACAYFWVNGFARAFWPHGGCLGT
jgi:hypothetical protein